MKETVIFGTPITPEHLLDQLAGSSFCVSYAYRERLNGQLDRIIDLVGEDGLLLVDNGAFTAWTRGRELDPEGFETWAADILARCPQAVAVIPDVIGGTVEENMALVHECELPMERVMPVWHMHEPLDYLVHLVESGFFFIAIGSSGEYAKTGTPAWHARVREAFTAIDELCAGGAYSRPHIHMMRAQAFGHLYDFDSTDSSNVAVNHHRYKHQGPGHLGRFADRIRSRILATCDMVTRVDTPAEIAALFSLPSITTSRRFNHVTKDPGAALRDPGARARGGRGEGLAVARSLQVSDVRILVRGMGAPKPDRGIQKIEPLGPFGPPGARSDTG